MIDMRLKSFQKMFFPSKAIPRRVDAASRKVLSKFGAFVRRTARSSIRKRKGASKPGRPPSSHTGLLKKFIWFGYEPNRKSVVIGPAKLTSKNTDAPETLEYGGTTTLMETKWTGRKRKKRQKQRVRIAARPFMGPAMEKETPKLSSMWRESVK